MSDYLRYDPLQAPEVQVLDDDTWWDGYAEARRQDGDGALAGPLQQGSE